ncbi:BrnT family toxin [Alcaligenaceae bacterium]|nr:BrnT family toxin [Alcaligenaceae bacterium]
MNYVFDPAKNALNVRNHGVFFAAAADFDWETAVVDIDDRYEYGEARLIATGLIGERVYVMVFNLRETSVRIISLRRANRREVKRYASHI